MAKKTKKPNVIWILADQLRAQALHCNGDPNVKTPNIDILAATGVNFTNAISGYPLCCPARGSILTSKYPHKCVPMHESPLPSNQHTIADVFNEEGYHTAYFGKWHLDGFKEGEGKRAAHHIVPPDRRGGFKHWVGYENNNSPWDTWVHGGEGDESFHYRLQGYETDELTNLFMQYLEKQKDKQKDENQDPFFAVLSVQAPHDPYYAPAEYMKNYSKSSVQLRSNVPNIPNVEKRTKKDLCGYYAMVENLDWNIGRIRQKLFDLDMIFNTHIIFFSDHGDMLGSHGQIHKTSPYEESIRVPFIISGEQPHYDGRKNGESNALINHVDVAPTTLGLCGIEPPEWMEGTDYSYYRLTKDEKKDQPESAYIQNLNPRKNVDRPWR